MWIEVSEKAAALLMSLGRVLLKGRTHKYIRRVPKPGGGYRYYYKTSGVTRSVKDDLAEGAKFRLTHEGQEGHFEVVGRSGDTVTLRDLVRLSENEVMNLKNLGRTSLTEIKAKLAERGLSLGMPVD